MGNATVKQFDGDSECPETSLPAYYSEAFKSVDQLAQTLDRVLNDKEEQAKLMAFLKSEFAEELLECYEMIRAFEKKPDRIQADNIIQVFLAHDASRFIHCKPWIQRKVMKKVEQREIDANIFAALKHDLVVMIARDRLNRFVEARKLQAIYAVAESECSLASDEKPNYLDRLSSKLMCLHDSTTYITPDVIRDSLEESVAQASSPPMYDDTPIPISRFLFATSSSSSSHGAKDTSTPIKSSVHQNQSPNSVKDCTLAPVYPFKHPKDIFGTHSIFLVSADGYGSKGSLIADCAVKMLFCEMRLRLDRLSTAQTQWISVLRSAFDTVDKKITNLKYMHAHRKFSGCTLLAAILTHPTLHVAYAGDCKLVLASLPPDEDDDNLSSPSPVEPATNVVSNMIEDVDVKILVAQECKLVARRLTKESTPTDDPRTRIKSCGDIAKMQTGEVIDRTLLDEIRKAPGLQSTSSLSDHTSSNSFRLLARPGTASFELTRRDKFIILASSGFWKYVNEKQAVRFVEASLRLHSRQHDRVQIAARYLVSIATKHWQNEGTCVDDVSVTILVIPS